MPAKDITANTSGAALWNEELHKGAELLGVTIDNKHTEPETLQLMDCFATDASKLGSTGADQAAEYLGVSGCASGRLRLQMTVPAGETQKLGEEDCKGIEFIGSAYGIGSVTNTNCVIICQYRFK